MRRPLEVRQLDPAVLRTAQLRRMRAADGRTVYVGDSITDAGSDPQAVRDWTAQVTAQGLVATRMPSGILKGQLATRLKVADPQLGWNYQLAPFSVRVQDNAGAIENQITITAGEIAGDLQAASMALLQAPGNALSWALGVPKWALWLGGGILAYVVIVTVLPRTTGWKSVG